MLRTSEVHLAVQDNILTPDASKTTWNNSRNELTHKRQVKIHPRF